MASQKTFTLVRSCSERTSDERFNQYVDEIANKAINHVSISANFTVSVSKAAPDVDKDESTGIYVFKKKISFKRIRGHAGTEDKQWKLIVKNLLKAGDQQRWGKYPWSIEGENINAIRDELVLSGAVAPMANSVVVKGSSTIKNLGDVSIDPKDYFDHIYGREHQIKIVHSAIIAGKETDWVNRFHCILHGPPGCGKSDILISTGKMLGFENDAFMKFDATSTTEAGAQRILLEAEHIPPVLMVEEIEKTDEKALRWLLGVLDHRAEIRKTNFNIGNRARNVKMLCLATVNDLDLFKKVMSGALASRFAHEIHCPRPDRVILEKILEREVAKINGRREWIAPTLEYCVDEKKLDDPRKIIPVCLCGRDDLLDGSYQHSLRATETPKKGA